VSARRSFRICAAILAIIANIAASAKQSNCGEFLYFLKGRRFAPPAGLAAAFGPPITLRGFAPSGPAAAAGPASSDHGDHEDAANRHDQSSLSFAPRRSRQPASSRRRQSGGYPLTVDRRRMRRPVGSRSPSSFGGPDAFNSTETPMMSTRNIAIAAFIIAVLVLLILLL
jgi:hypothetical protein